VRPIKILQYYMTEVAAVQFETGGKVLFSPLEQKLGLTYTWRKWSKKVLCITTTGSVIAKRDKNDAASPAVYHLTKVSVEEMVHHSEEQDIGEENGLVVSCQTPDGYNTSFRCILNEVERTAFKEAIRAVAKEHNLDADLRSSITDRVAKARKPRWTLRSQKSVMRRAIATAMDKHDKRSVKDRVVAKRGAMKYLPVLFHNDLLHGSW
jgi:transcriptional regulatory protein LevR